jgi:hypothetical protein
MFEDLDWIQLVEASIRWRALVNTVINWFNELFAVSPHVAWTETDKHVATGSIYRENKAEDSIRGVEFLDYLRDYQFLIKDSSPRSWKSEF